MTDHVVVMISGFFVQVQHLNNDNEKVELQNTIVPPPPVFV